MSRVLVGMFYVNPGGADLLTRTGRRRRRRSRWTRSRGPECPSSQSGGFPLGLGDGDYPWDLRGRRLSRRHRDTEGEDGGGGGVEETRRFLHRTSSRQRSPRGAPRPGRRR